MPVVTVVLPHPVLRQAGPFLATFVPPMLQSAQDDDNVLVTVDAQGNPVDIGGYYRPDETLTEQAMRPSQTLNRIIDRL